MQTFDEYLAAIRSDINARKASNDRLPIPKYHFGDVCPGSSVWVQPEHETGWLGKMLFPVDGVPGWWVITKPGDLNRSVRTSDIVDVCSLS